MYNPGFAKSKRSPRSKHERKAYVPVPLEVISAWIIRGFVLAIILALPWYFGCATWSGQQYLFMAAVLLAILVGVHCVICLVKRKGNSRIPWLSWVFFGLGGLAWVQSQGVFSWESSFFSPPSVAVQRWALGVAEAPSALEPFLLTRSIENLSAETESKVLCDLKDIPQDKRFLAWSIEPMHTKAAMAAMFLCGLLIWVGTMVFSEPLHQLCLFGVMTLGGVLIACFGIQCAISYQTENFLGLTSGGSYATFVSKNSAGGFLNVCIAGALGLLGWTLLNTKRKSNDVRYKFPDANPLLKIRGLIEDLLSDLNTPQIASMLCLITIVASLVISLCRGAALSAFAAMIASVLLANAKNQSRGAVATSFALTLVSLACLLGFQLDDQAYTRLESVSEIDLEEELRTGRAYIWGVAWQATKFYGWLGSGLGTFHFAYLPFQRPSSPNWYYHAESLYAQCAVELGLLGMFLLIASLVAVFVTIQRKLPTEDWRVVFPAKLAVGYLLFSQALHSFVDFAMIVPSLWVPACVLLGSVMGLYHRLGNVPASSRKHKQTPTKHESNLPKEATAQRSRVLGLGLSICLVFGFYLGNASVQSLATSDSMEKWVRQEEKKPLSDRSREQVMELAKMWSKNQYALEENSAAMRLFADAYVSDYRIRQVSGAAQQTEANQAWINSSPVLLNVILEQELNPKNRERVIEAVGGNAALSKLANASKWYVLGQSKSPLDWRFLSGRCSTNLSCTPAEMVHLVQQHNQLSMHNAQKLLSASILFRNFLGPKDLEAIRFQAMKSSIASSIGVAKLIANEADDDFVSIDIFPQRSEVMQALALQVFKKDQFPKTYFALWERARKLISASPMTESRREIWLADASLAIEDSLGEIEHLKNAIRYEPTNVKLICRLSNRLIESGELQQARTYCDQARRLDPLDEEVKALVARVLQF